MDKKQQDFTIHVNEQKTLYFEIEDAPQDDMSFLDVEWSVTKLNDLSDVIITKTTADGDVSWETDNPVFYLSLDEPDFENIDERFYQHQAIVEDTDGNKSVTHGGYIEVFGSVENPIVPDEKLYGNSENIKGRTGTTAEALSMTDVQYDLLLNVLLNQASREIDHYCERVFYEITDFTEFIQPNNREVIITNNYPITSINTIKENNETVDPDNYRIVKKGEPVNNIGEIRKTNGKWRHEVEINYDYGFSSIPYDIRKISEDMVIRGVNEANAEVKASGADSISMDGYSVDFGTVSSEELIRLTDSQVKKLSRYKKFPVG